MHFLAFTIAAILVSFAASWRCPGNWMTFADHDPHLVVNFTNPSFDRPVCFDLGGEPGESYTLFSVKNSFKFVGNLIQAVHKADGKNWTYFGSFTFNCIKDGVFVNIDETWVNVTEGGKTTCAPWPHKAPYDKQMYPAEFEGKTTIVKGLHITHNMNNYLRLQFKGSDGNKTSFLIDRHNRKFCNSHTDCHRVHYLGVYLNPSSNANYDGVLGEHVNETAIFVNKTANPLNRLRAFADVNAVALLQASNHAILHNGQTLKVTDHQVLDRMKNEYRKCWKIIENDKFMHHKLSYYKTL